MMLGLITMCGCLPVALFVKSAQLLNAVNSVSMAFLLFFCCIIALLPFSPTHTGALATHRPPCCSCLAMLRLPLGPSSCWAAGSPAPLILPATHLCRPAAVVALGGRAGGLPHRVLRLHRAPGGLRLRLWLRLRLGRCTVRDASWGNRPGRAQPAARALARMCAPPAGGLGFSPCTLPVPTCSGPP